MNKNLPIVTIVGRANVGKSSLFNRLLGQRKAIVDDTPGTTRDRVEAIVNWQGANFWLVDTAGLERTKSSLGKSIQSQIEIAKEQADIILVVVDGSTILSEEDISVIKSAYKSAKPVIVAINKSDRRVQNIEKDKLPGENHVAVSAIHGTGSGDLLDAISKLIKKTEVKQAPQVPTLALLGRPNVGKSSLLNALVKTDRAIVADQPGTTRDITEAPTKFEGEDWQIIDTAGLRRKSKTDTAVEYFSTLRSMQAINSSDVCALVLDAEEPATAQDQRIAGMVKEAGKGLFMIVNKWDKTERDDTARRNLEMELRRTFGFVWWAPLVLTSATESHNINKLLPMAATIKKNLQTKIPTSKLNNLLEEAVAGHPPAGLKNRHPKLNYITQTDINPPTFTVFGSQTPFLHWSYKRYLEGLLREKFDFEGVPIRMKWRPKHKESKTT